MHMDTKDNFLYPDINNQILLNL